MSDDLGRTEIEVVQAVRTYIVNVTNVDEIDNDFAAVLFQTTTLRSSSPLKDMPSEGIAIGMNLPTAQRLRDELEQLVRSLEDRLGNRLREKYPPPPPKT